MYAREVVVELTTVRDSLERVRAARRPTEEVAPWDVAETGLEAAATAAESIATVGRLPRLRHTSDPSLDRVVRTVLDLSYEAGEPTRDEVGDGVDAALDAGRLVAGDSHAGESLAEGSSTGDSLAVPLSRETAANWYVVLPWTADRLGELGRTCELLAGRFEAVEASSLAAAYDDLARATREFGALLEWLSTLALWYGPPEELVGADYGAVESFARRTIEAASET